LREFGVARTVADVDAARHGSTTSSLRMQSRCIGPDRMRGASCGLGAQHRRKLASCFLARSLM
jgi:hypothetical protein